MKRKIWHHHPPHNLIPSLDVLTTTLPSTILPLLAFLKVECSFEAIDGEGDNASKDGRATVDQGDHDGLTLKVVVVMVIAGKGNK